MAGAAEKSDCSSAGSARQALTRDPRVTYHWRARGQTGRTGQGPADSSRKALHTEGTWAQLQTSKQNLLESLPVFHAHDMAEKKVSHAVDDRSRAVHLEALNV